MLKTTPTGEPTAERSAAVKVCSALPSPQLTTTEPPLPPGNGRKSALVAPGLASLKAPMRAGDVGLPSTPEIVVPFKLVSAASRTVTPPPGGLVNVVVAPPRVVMMTLRVLGRPGGVPPHRCGFPGPQRAGRRWPDQSRSAGL